MQTAGAPKLLFTANASQFDHSLTNSIRSDSLPVHVGECTAGFRNSKNRRVLRRLAAAVFHRLREQVVNFRPRRFGFGGKIAFQGLFERP
jgi:hypothetical protein